MGGFGQGFAQFVQGGIKGWETMSDWQKEEAAEKFAEESRNEIRRQREAQGRVRDKYKSFKVGDPTLDTADGSGDDAAQPDQQYIAEAPEPTGAIAATPAQTAAMGTTPAASAAMGPAAAPAGMAPPMTMAALGEPPPPPPGYTPAAGGLPATDAETAAAATAPAPTATAQPVAVAPEDEPVVVKDRLLGTPVNTTRGKTRPANDFDVALHRYEANMEEGFTAEANAVMESYVKKNEAKMAEADRALERGMNQFIASGGQDRSGLNEANRLSPIGVDLSMQLDPSGSGKIAVGINMRGTKGSPMYRGPDGEISKTPIYMDPREGMVLAQGVGRGGTLAAMGTIVELRSKVLGMTSQAQGMKVQELQLVQNAVTLYQKAADDAIKNGQLPPDPDKYMGPLTLPVMREAFMQGIGQAPTPTTPTGDAPTPQNAAPAGSRGFMSDLEMAESGGRNIPSGVDSDPAGPGTKSQGYFQITTPTWQDFAGKAGVNLRQYPNAMSAPHDVQAKVASVIPFGRFGPRTQRILTEKYGPLDRKATVGELAARHGGGGGGGKLGLPATSAAEAAPPSSGRFADLAVRPDPKYAAAKLFTSKPKLDEGAQNAQQAATSKAAQATAAASKAAADGGKPLTQAQEDQVYKQEYEGFLRNYINSLPEGDRALLLPILMPNVQRANNDNRYTGPSPETRKSGNRFATDFEEQNVSYMRELIADQGKQMGDLSPHGRKLQQDAQWLRQNDPNYFAALVQKAKAAGPLGAAEGPNPQARRTKNIFATDTPKAVEMMAGIMPYISGRGYGMVQSADVKAKIKAFDELRQLDPRFAALIERMARDRIGAIGMVGLSGGMK